MIKDSIYLHYSTFLTSLILTKITLLLVLDHHGLPPDFSDVANRNSFLCNGLWALYCYEKLLTLLRALLMLLE